MKWHSFTCAALVVSAATLFAHLALHARTVPQMIKFAGVVTVPPPNTQIVGVTFALYKEEQGGAPLWIETQNVQVDRQGRYTVLLGSTKADGVPTDLFTSGQARWLGVQVEGEPEQARVLLVSVPYALKAGDAETLGGKPASAFALSASQSAAPTTSRSQSLDATKKTATLANISGSGTTGFIPRWTSSSALGNSILFQNSTGFLGLGTTLPTQKFQVNSGDVLIKGPNNFVTAGSQAHLYLGGANHFIMATYGLGVTIGGVSVPNAFFIQDKTGNVGIGTTMPKSKLFVNGVEQVGLQTNTPTAMLNVSSNAQSYSGLAVTGFPGSGNFGTGTDAIDAFGGSGPGTGSGGNGIVAYGGNGNAPSSSGGSGVIGHGGGGSNGQNGAGVAGDGFPGVSGIGTCCAPWGDGDGVYGTNVDGGTFATSGAYAGDFSGDVNVTGTIFAGTKDFKIDHPLDPANKYLVHASVESSEMLNVYSGNVVLDSNGGAVVTLPEWFEAENGDFRYQLTAIGAPAPGLYVAQEIANHQFRIAGGHPGAKVSWQVTGVRQDAFAKAHPLVAEQIKSPRERGFYIHPELFGASEERGIEWNRHANVMRKVKRLRIQQARRALQVRR